MVCAKSTSLATSRFSRRISTTNFGRRFSTSTYSRSDADYLALFHTRLATLYDESLPQFNPIYTAVADAVASNHLAPLSILDLASGHGEPACTLAQRFPQASIVASDTSAEERERSAQRLQSLGLSDRVSVEPIDLADLHVLAKLEEAQEPLPKVDVLTCSLGLFMLDPREQEPCMRGLRALLNPNGLLVATVWEDMALVELGGACVAAGAAVMDPSLPAAYDANSLGGGRADALLAGAGFESRALTPPHNDVHALALHLGAARSDAAFMLAMTPYAAALELLSSKPDDEVPPGVFGRAHAAFDALVDERGYVDGAGDVVVPLRWRMLAARRPLL